MRSNVVHNFIDRKIEKLIAEKKGFDEVVEFLNDRISKRSETDSRFKEYIAQFSQKRIDDISFVKNLEGFKELSVNSTFNLIRLRDKVIGKQEFDL